MTKPFTPSPTKLLSMIAAANAKCDADREQAFLQVEARQDAAAARAWGRQVEARFYARISAA